MTAGGLLFGVIVFTPGALFYLLFLRPKDTAVTEAEHELSTISETVAGVRATAAERPDHVYDAQYVDVLIHEGVEYRRRSGMGDCDYVEDDENGQLCGSCLVGWGAIAAGIKPVELMYGGDPLGLFRKLDIFPGFYERQDVGEANYEQAVSETNWLGLVQKWQDRGWPWGHAVAMADLGHLPPHPNVEDWDELDWKPLLEVPPASA